MAEFSFRVYRNGDGREVFDPFYNGLYMETFYMAPEDNGKMAFSSSNGLNIKQIKRDRFKFVSPCGTIYETEKMPGLRYWMVQGAYGSQTNMSMSKMIFTNCAEVIIISSNINIHSHSSPSTWLIIMWPKNNSFFFYFCVPMAHYRGTYSPFVTCIIEQCPFVYSYKNPYTKYAPLCSRHLPGFLNE